MSAAIKRALLPANLYEEPRSPAPKAANSQLGRTQGGGRLMVRFLAIVYGQVLNSYRAVILMTAFQHPHPCFLEQVFGDGTICRQAHKVTAVDAGSAR
jgi:hypothetical protein